MYIYIDNAGGFGFGGGGFSGGDFGGNDFAGGGLFTGQGSSASGEGFFFGGPPTTSQQQQQTDTNGEKSDLISRVLLLNFHQKARR